MHKQLVKAMGLWLLGSEESLPVFGIATMVASLQEGGKIPDSKMELKTVSHTKKKKEVEEEENYSLQTEPTWEHKAPVSYTHLTLPTIVAV